MRAEPGTDRLKREHTKHIITKCLIVVFWLCVWQCATHLADNAVLLVGPLQTGKAFLENIGRPDFVKIILCSFARIGSGFFAALVLGLAAGAFACRYAWLALFLSPVMTALKSVPVASFTVLLLIWSGSSGLSFWISLLIVFPNVYVNTMAGLQSTDPKLLEMAKLSGMGGWNRFCYLYRPALMPYLIGCLRISLGMSWKSGVAAEVIGLPAYSLGERLYMAKIYLDTAGLFAWTLTVILLSFLFEKGVLYLAVKFAAWKPCPAGNGSRNGSGRGRKKAQTGYGKAGHRKTGEADSVPTETGDAAIQIRDLEKAYGEDQVIRKFTYTMEPGRHYCLMAPSGGGKTTLLRLLTGMERPDGGTIEGVPEQIGMVFQEDRLCEEFDTITNVMICVKGMDRGKVYEEACRILPEDSLNKPVRELSGGMRRRCAILRAMLSRADILIMDEPFTGLDEENRRKTATYILENLQGRTLLATSHREEDLVLLDGIRIGLE